MAAFVKSWRRVHAKIRRRITACHASDDTSAMLYSATFARTKPTYARDEATNRRTRPLWRRSRSALADSEANDDNNKAI